jgi:hypothetical protein
MCTVLAFPVHFSKMSAPFPTRVLLKIIGGTGALGAVVADVFAYRRERLAATKEIVDASEAFVKALNAFKKIQYLQNATRSITEELWPGAANSEGLNVGVVMSNPPSLADTMPGAKTKREIAAMYFEEEETAHFIASFMLKTDYLMRSGMLDTDAIDNLKPLCIHGEKITRQTYILMSIGAAEAFPGERSSAQQIGEDLANVAMSWNGGTGFLGENGVLFGYLRSRLRRAPSKFRQLK